MAKNYTVGPLTTTIFQLHPEIKTLSNPEWRRIRDLVKSGKSISEATVEVTSTRPREKYRAIPLEPVQAAAQTADQTDATTTTTIAGLEIEV